MPLCSCLQKDGWLIYHIYVKLLIKFAPYQLVVCVCINWVFVCSFFFYTDCGFFMCPAFRALRAHLLFQLRTFSLWIHYKTITKQFAAQSVQPFWRLLYTYGQTNKRTDRQSIFCTTAVVLRIFNFVLFLNFFSFIGFCVDYCSFYYICDLWFLLFFFVKISFWNIQGATRGVQTSKLLIFSKLLKILIFLKRSKMISWLGMGGGGI